MNELPVSVAVTLVVGLLMFAANMAGHAYLRRTGHEQVTVSRETLGQDVEKIVTARMEHYREEMEGLVQSGVSLSTVLSAEVARLQSQVGVALNEIAENRITIKEQASQISTQAVQILGLHEENHRCLDALLEREKREHERDRRDSVRSAHLRAAADA